MDWMTLESRVKTFSRLIYNREAKSIVLDGMQFDCFLQIADDYAICIEVTQNHTLDKVRNDINKLLILKNNNNSKGIFTKCIMILQNPPSDLMKQTANASKIELLSLSEFESKFIDYRNYVHLRKQKNIGSAIDPWTGEIDSNPYVPVKYIDSRTNKELKIEDIKQLLDKGNKIILKGSFGSGKSRCLREIFTKYTGEHDNAYCFAINLRENWSLKRANEIIRRHFEDLAFPPEAVNNSVKLFEIKKCIFMLDGFDEVGSQNWSNEPTKLSQAKQDALIGVKDIIQNTKGGVIITGRENYFNSDAEMFNFLGLKESETLLLECAEQFNEDEMKTYMHNIGCEDYILPHWAPWKPLIFQMIASLAGKGDLLAYENEFAFWDKLISFICSREATIKKTILDPETIRQILIELANLTRIKNNDFGPITINEVSSVFSNITGRSATDESAIILSRLPSFGRVGNESSDYQFIDLYMLDGLRAEYMISHYDTDVISKTSTWTNPLREFGQRLLYNKIANKEPSKIVSKILLWSNTNTQASADLLCAFMNESDSEDIINFRRLSINDCFIEKLDLSNISFGNLNISECMINSIDITDCYIEPKESISFDGCEINLVTGISDISALPNYFSNCRVEQFSSVNTTSKIKRLGLKNHQVALLSCIRRVFIQGGRGRKERSLIKGFKNQQEKKAVNKIVELLLKYNVIETVNGDEGYIYKAINSARHRMLLITHEMNTSKDDIWIEATKLDMAN
ncbi:hypothetical protein SAMN04487787_103279 [Kosakonia sacchari]|nr:hypothetical protein SAMN04487787_103279 [Kosakonia sacchari]